MFGVHVPCKDYNTISCSPIGILIFFVKAEGWYVGTKTGLGIDLSVADTFNSNTWISTQ